MPESSSSFEEPEVLSVSRLTQKLQWTLRDKFFDLRVSGEITNLTQPGSGHVYLTLGDDHAQIKAVIWRADAERVEFALENGLQVTCRGEIDIYPPRGVYQLIVRHIELQGVGAQQLALRKLHARLATEGLFNPEIKKPLPVIPRRIGVVTSPTGAAIQDFLKVVCRRWANVEILIIPVRVQGHEAPKEIARGISIATRLKNPPDVLVVTRGGGSAEDLWSFNDERVVRAIAACPIPVVSGVGHEIDVTLCDLVADVRALTPSEAGELVVPVRDQVKDTLADMQERMRASLRKSVRTARERLVSIESRPVLSDPAQLLNTPRRKVDEFEMRLTNAGRRRVEKGHNALAVLAGRLQAISPVKVLARGYTVTEAASGTAIRSTRDIRVGDQLVTRLANGRIESQVTRVEPGEEPRHVN